MSKSIIFENITIDYLCSTGFSGESIFIMDIGMPIKHRLKPRCV